MRSSFNPVLDSGAYALRGGALFLKIPMPSGYPDHEGMGMISKETPELRGSSGRP